MIGHLGRDGPKAGMILLTRVLTALGKILQILDGVLFRSEFDRRFLRTTPLGGLYVCWLKCFK